MSPSSDHSARFSTTQWTEIVSASRDDPAGREALDRLCSRYWYPLYAFLRRSGHSADDAQDHVQSFFADLLDREAWLAADRERGKFRSFLLTACQNHVRNRVRHRRAAKRGGGQPVFSFSVAEGEERYTAEPAIDDDPSAMFDRQWALALIDSALTRLGTEMQRSGRGDRFESLRPLVAPVNGAPSYAAVAESLGTTEGNIKVAVHRLRKKFAEILRDEVAVTLAPPNQEYAGNGHPSPRAVSSDRIDDEIALLMQAICR